MEAGDGKGKGKKGLDQFRPALPAINFPHTSRSETHAGKEESGGGGP